MSDAERVAADEARRRDLDRLLERWGFLLDLPEPAYDGHPAAIDWQGWPDVAPPR